MTGCDFAGEVIEGDEDGKFVVGDKVFALQPILDQQGTCAEYITAKPSHLAKIPTNLDMVQAAAFPLVGLTAYQALRKVGVDMENPKANEGKTVLIHAGAGGVGSIAIQIAKVSIISKKNIVEFMYQSTAGSWSKSVYNM